MNNLIRLLFPKLVLIALCLPIAAFAATPRIGSCRVDLPQAKAAGIEGVELRVGTAQDRLEISDPAYREKIKQQKRETGVAVSSIMMGLFNQNPLVSDPRAVSWIEQVVEAAADLDAKVILVAFFGKGDLRKEGRLNDEAFAKTIEILKQVAPKAAAAGVTLAVENTLSAEQNIEMLRRIGHPAVRLYYDVGNSTNNGYDILAEIKLLGNRIACIHFKDAREYLGEGKINFVGVARTLREISYKGWIVLEAASPSKDEIADARRNAGFIRTLFKS